MHGRKGKHRQRKQRLTFNESIATGGHRGYIPQSRRKQIAEAQKEMQQLLLARKQSAVEDAPTPHNVFSFTQAKRRAAGDR